MTALTATPESCYYMGNSMRRVFQVGDKLYLEARPLPEIRVGDIVCFVNPVSQVNVVHRVVKVLPEGVVTWGDNNDQPDPGLVDASNYLGIVVKYSHLGQEKYVRNGLSGKRQFRLNRIRRKCREMAGKLFRLLCGGWAPLWFLRGWFGPLTVKEFAHGKMCFAAGETLVAVRKKDQQKWQIPGIKKLFFSSQWLENKFHE